MFTMPFSDYLERQIDGETFSNLSREDIATIFPAHEKFILASKLYKIIQLVRKAGEASSQTVNDQTSDFELSCTSSTSTGSSVNRKRASKPDSMSDSAPLPKKKNTGPFKLPVYSPDIQNCIKRDAFYTLTQRNRLIRESCVALRGYCWKNGDTVSNERKRSLAKMLQDLAPKSLSDNKGDKKKGPEVSEVTVLKFQHSIYPTQYSVVYKGDISL